MCYGHGMYLVDRTCNQDLPPYCAVAIVYVYAMVGRPVVYTGGEVSHSAGCIREHSSLTKLPLMWEPFSPVSLTSVFPSPGGYSRASEP